MFVRAHSFHIHHPRSKDRAELQANLFMREGDQFRPLFEPSIPVAALKIKLNPRGKRKGPEQVEINYYEIKPTKGFVRTENVAFAKYNTEAQPANRIELIFQRGQAKKVVGSFIRLILTHNYHTSLHK